MKKLKAGTNNENHFFFRGFQPLPSQMQNFNSFHMPKRQFRRRKQNNFVVPGYKRRRYPPYNLSPQDPGFFFVLEGLSCQKFKETTSLIDIKQAKYNQNKSFF